MTLENFTLDAHMLTLASYTLVYVTHSPSCKQDSQPCWAWQMYPVTHNKFTIHKLTSQLLSVNNITAVSYVHKVLVVSLPSSPLTTIGTMYSFQSVFSFICLLNEHIMLLFVNLEGFQCRHNKAITL